MAENEDGYDVVIGPDQDGEVRVAFRHTPPDGAIRVLFVVDLDEAFTFLDLFPDAMNAAWLPLEIGESSNIAQAIYCRNEATLRVTFKNGGVYDYFAVTPDVAEDFAEAESPGRFLSRVLKQEALYPCRKVESA